MSSQTTNICDNYYLGTYRTLEALSPLLKKRSVNQHATLLTLYMMAVTEALKRIGTQASANLEVKALLPYMPMLMERCPRDDLFVHIVERASAFTRDCDRFFDE